MNDQIRIINVLLMEHRQSLDDAYRRIHDAEVEVKIWKVVVSKLESAVDKLERSIETDEVTEGGSGYLAGTATLMGKEQCEELNGL